MNENLDNREEGRGHPVEDRSSMELAKEPHEPVIEAQSVTELPRSRSAWKLYLPWMLAIVVVIVDQVTKYLVMSNMQLHERISVIGELLRWTYVHNHGMVFGLPPLGGRWILVGLNCLAMLLFIYLLVKMKHEPLPVRLILGGVIGGAIGNNIDRVRFGYVIDFIDVDLPDFLMERWYVFNVADSFVSVGITILVILMLFKPSLVISEPKDEPVDEEDAPESEREKADE